MNRPNPVFWTLAGIAAVVVLAAIVAAAEAHGRHRILREGRQV